MTIERAAEVKRAGDLICRCMEDMDDPYDIAQALSDAGLLAGGWRDIKDAPKDGTDIDVWSPRYGITRDVRWGMETCNGFADPKGGPGWVAETCDVTGTWFYELLVEQPTHWQPLPLPPAEG